MIISEQQARLAAGCVGPPIGAIRTTHPDISPELMERILIAIDATPELRAARVVEARARLAVGFPASEDIAEKIIARAISDALR
jgi:hypothetical protein